MSEVEGAQDEDDAVRDRDTNDVNPFLNPRALDINAGNRQVAHGIVFVLRPFDL